MRGEPHQKIVPNLLVGMGRWLAIGHNIAPGSKPHICGKWSMAQYQGLSGFVLGFVTTVLIRIVLLLLQNSRKEFNSRGKLTFYVRTWYFSNFLFRPILPSFEDNGLLFQQTFH